MAVAVMVQHHNNDYEIHILLSGERYDYEIYIIIVR